MMIVRIAIFAILAVSSLFTTTAHTQIYRWDNGQVIPGTESITLGPGVQLEGWNTAAKNLRFGEFKGDLSGASFYSNWLDDARFLGANLTGARLNSSSADNTSFADANLTSASLESSTLTNANLADANLNSANLRSAKLTNVNLSGANLASANLFSSTLTDANLSRAVVTGADFGDTTARGFTSAQLAATASYQAKNLQGIALGGNDRTGWEFGGQNLTNASLFRSKLTNANLTGSVVKGADFSRGGYWDDEKEQWIQYGLTQAQLESTASYQARSLQGITLSGNNLTGWDLRGQDLAKAELSSFRPIGGYTSNLTSINLQGANLTGAKLQGAYLADANLTGAVVTWASFAATTFREFTQAQLQSTASYQAKNLQGIDLQGNNLSGWDFVGQNLRNVVFFSADLSGASLIGADLRGTFWYGSGDAILGNTILPDGRLHRLVVAGQQSLIIRDDDGVPDPAPVDWTTPRSPIPVTVYDELKIAPGGVLQLVFADNDWGSTVKFQPGISVQLGGTLELTFTDDTQLATQSGRTIRAFDWTGVNPQGQFAVQGQPGTAWDTSKLYTAGEVTLLGISSDLNADQDVDSEDLLDFLANWTGSDYPAADKTWRNGDSDEDGDVDSSDVLVFLNQWTGAAAAEASQAVSVPEPSGVMLIGMALASLLTAPRPRDGRRLR